MSESVFVVEKKVLLDAGLLNEKYTPVSDASHEKLTKCLARGGYLERAKAETDTSVLQIIPYVSVMVGQGRVLTYRRAGSEDRLRDYYSIGFGGHVKKCEKGCISCAIDREMLEELGLVVYDSRLRLCGLIYDPSTEVSAVHFGLHYVYMLLETELNQLRPSDEISDMTVLNFEDLARVKLENWSTLCVQNSEHWLHVYDEVYEMLSLTRQKVKQALENLGK